MLATVRACATLCSRKRELICFAGEYLPLLPGKLLVIKIKNKIDFEERNTFQTQKSESLSVISLFFLKVVISTFATRKCIFALLKLAKRA